MCLRKYKKIECIRNAVSVKYIKSGTTGHNQEGEYEKNVHENLCVSNSRHDSFEMVGFNIMKG